MSRKTNLNLDEDSLKVIDPNQDQIEDSNISNEILELKEELNQESENINFELNNIINNEQEWVDENQISFENTNSEWHTNELRTTESTFVLHPTKKSVKKDLTKSLITSSLIVNLFFGIWLFILCMVSPIFAESGNIATLFYKATAESPIFAFNTLGYVNLLFTILVFTLNIVTLSFRIKSKNKEFYFNNLKKKANVVFYTFLALYLTTVLLMTLNLLIPPLGINNGSSYFSIMYTLSGIGITQSAGWYIIIVLFSVSISLYFITLIVLAMLESNVLNIAKIKEKHQVIKSFFADLKRIQKEKKANKEKKKQILAEEEELLNNLQEVTEEQKQLISEEEFQERIKSNNEIKNKIKELQKQQEEIKKQQSIFLKNRKEDTINRRPLKPKKQEITIPDKELEEIFKNIDLD